MVGVCFRFVRSTFSRQLIKRTIPHLQFVAQIRQSNRGHVSLAPQPTGSALTICLNPVRTTKLMLPPARSNNLGMRARCCCAHLRISCRASLPQPAAPTPARSALVRGCHRRKLLHIQTLRISFRAVLSARIKQRLKSCPRIQAGSAHNRRPYAPRTPCTNAL